jgi:predicted membrane channel-forming protein YqfA (hemolysin III family)
VHKFYPKQVCLFTCHKWWDLFFFLILAMMLIFTSHSIKTPLLIRYVSFFLISTLLAYVLSLQYNLIAFVSKKEKQTAQTFFQAILLVLVLVILNIVILPFTMRYMNLMYVLSLSLFLCLVGLLLWGLFVGKHFLLWVSVSLFVFLGFLLTDMTILVRQCKKAGTPQCDPLNGASLLYVDLVNILQQIFILLNDNRQ